MRHGRGPMEPLDRWVDEKTGAHRLFSDDSAKKGKGYDMSQLPQITKEKITLRINDKRRD